MVFKRITAALRENFGLGRRAALTIMIVAGLMLVFACWWFFHSAPPKTIIITSGDKESLYYGIAEKYARILARDGVKLNILPSAGAVENLRRLADPSFQVDIGFVQAGLDLGVNSENLVSLGSVSYQPLLVFHRLPPAVIRLSQLAGKRLAVGREGSGTRLLAVKLLAMNGIEPGGSTEFLAWEGEAAAAALLKGEIDAAFFMADAAASGTMRSLLQASGIGLADFNLFTLSPKPSFLTTISTLHCHAL